MVCNLRQLSLHHYHYDYRYKVVCLARSCVGWQAISCTYKTRCGRPHKTHHEWAVKIGNNGKPAGPCSHYYYAVLLYGFNLKPSPFYFNLKIFKLDLFIVLLVTFEIFNVFCTSKSIKLVVKIIYRSQGDSPLFSS